MLLFFSVCNFFILFQLRMYNAVVEDVISNLKDPFLDAGVDEQVLQELKTVSFLFIKK